MAKKSRTRHRAPAPLAEGEVGPRQPCPCGSGRRYKHCHGSGDTGDVYVARPFEGLPWECDLVALRELGPAAPAPVTVEGAGHGERTVTVCTLLPMAAPAMVRESGDVWLALQVQHQFGDPSRDLAAVLAHALEAAEAGRGPGPVGLTDPPGAGPRLQDMVTNDRLEVTVHDGFGFWVADADDDPTTAAALEQANAAASPSARLTSVEAAYWTDVCSKEHLRWVMPQPETQLLDALARLHAAGRDRLADESRLVGMFRAHGLLVPVWDLPSGTGAEALEEPADRFATELAEVLAAGSPLTSEERAARAGLANRQVTLRS
jgi:hypothetical protein